MNPVYPQYCHRMTIVQEMFSTTTRDTDLRHWIRDHTFRGVSGNHRSLDTPLLDIFDVVPRQFRSHRAPWTRRSRCRSGGLGHHAALGHSRRFDDIHRNF